MKKIIVLTAFVASMFNTINAQDNDNKTDYRDKLMFGLKAGANYSNVYDSQGEEFQADPKLGLAAGAFLAIPMGRFLGIQPEVLLSQKGFMGTGRILGSTYKFTRTTSYMDLPLLFAFKPSEFVTLLAGPQYSYLLNQKDVFANSTTSFEQETEFENDNIRKNTLCFLGGVDLTLKHLVLGARAGWDLQNNNGDGTSATPQYKNVWYQATIGYRFYKTKTN
jgi:hypothetical protein